MAAVTKNINFFNNCPLLHHPFQVWFNLVQGFQRRRFKCESLRRMMDDGRQVMAKAHLAYNP
jgi:hypothetical protein